MASPFSILTKRRFAPLFVTNFFGTFNDNLFKTALLLMASYGIYRAEPQKAALLATVATGAYVLPFFLASALAGQIADALERARLVRYVKVAETAIMALGLAGFAIQSIPVLLGALCLMGLHSAVYGPLKYAILPMHLPEGELLAGTGLMEGGGFLAILGGQLLAGLIKPMQAGGVGVALGVLGLMASVFILPARPAAEREAIDLNIARSSLDLIRLAHGIRPVWLSFLGIGWFYAVGAILLTELAPLVHGELNAEPSVVVLFLSLFSVGVACGAVVVNRLLKGLISARFTPVSALVLGAVLTDFSFAVGGFKAPGQVLTLAGFLAAPGAWRMVADLAVIALSGGVFVIPLRAIVQARSPEAVRSRIQSANAIVNALMTVGAIVFATVALKLGVDIAHLVLVLGVATLGVAGFCCVLLPETVIKALARALLKLLYRVEVTGVENMPPEGIGAVVVVNHVSYLDGLLLAAFLPGKPTFAVHTRIVAQWWMKPVLPFFNAFPVDTTNPLSAKAMVKAVQKGRTLVIFPEGRITVTGSLMKVFAGPGMVADKAQAPVIPVRIDGAQYTRFSHLKGKVRLRRFPRIHISILPAQTFCLEGSARQRRAAGAEHLYDIMSEMMFRTSETDRTLFQALLDARAVHGAKAGAVEDAKRAPLSYGRLVIGARLLARQIAPHTKAGEAVGFLLPNVNAAVAAFFALQSGGRVPAMLNYATGPANVLSACNTAKVAVVITSRAFVEQAKLEPVIEKLQASGRTILWLEDLGARISGPAKLIAALTDRFVSAGKRGPDADKPAVILFTSGSEGQPKGVVLSHRNILANCAQVASRIDFNPTDKVLNALPIFHSFGLTGGLLLPLLNGVKVLLYPNPLHYAAIPAFAYDASATILFGSDTFLAGYAQKAQGYDFYSLRYIFAGAERVKPETRALYAEKFGLRILEGYGATECSPVIAVNTPMHYQAGSVGRLLPAMQAKLEPVPGIEEGGRLIVRGPNVMAGYVLADAPGVLQPPEGGWHDTGDVVSLDAHGFITILGRVRRFAKIGGEMVSLAAVEGYAAAVWPEAQHAAVSRPDPKKGEQLVLFTTAAGAEPRALSAWARGHGVAELMLPKDVRVLDALPVLATGKTDYAALAALAKPAQTETAA